MKCAELIDIFEAIEMCPQNNFLRENYSTCVAMDSGDFHDGALHSKRLVLLSIKS